MYDKTYKSVNDLYTEWFYGQRVIEQNKRIEELRKSM